MKSAPSAPPVCSPAIVLSRSSRQILCGDHKGDLRPQARPRGASTWLTNGEAPPCKSAPSRDPAPESRPDRAGGRQDRALQTYRATPGANSRKLPPLHCARMRLDLAQIRPQGPVGDRVPWRGVAWAGRPACLPAWAELIRRPRRAARRWDHRSKGRWFPASCNGRAERPIRRFVRAGWRRRGA